MKRICTILLACIVYSATAQTKQGNPITLGVTEKIKSSILGETRELNIYLPPGYKAQDTTQYPVIYLLDGGLDEDFIHIVGLVQFNTFPWVNRIPPSIVVGIVNTDRKRDMSFPTTLEKEKKKFPTTGGSANFISFLEKETIPYVQTQYKTNGSRTLIGESFAGLLAAEILLKKPQLFNKYIIISPSLWWDNGSLLKAPMKLSATNPSTHIDVYIGVGKEGLAPSPDPHVMEVDANVLVDRINELHNGNINLQFDYLPDEDHGTIDHLAVLNAFKKLQPKK